MRPLVTAKGGDESSLFLPISGRKNPPSGAM
uniref:Uncharacterized protein n=1 Tax=Rhizophora mucronata TaxID=61149 RepID=A0A2P2J1H5_RHIMU